MFVSVTYRCILVSVTTLCMVSVLFSKSPQSNSNKIERLLPVIQDGAKGTGKVEKNNYEETRRKRSCRMALL